jgi:transposase-like protein
VRDADLSAKEGIALKTPAQPSPRRAAGHPRVTRQLLMRVHGRRATVFGCGAAGDQDDVLDMLAQRSRHAKAAKRFFRTLLQECGGSPAQLADADADAGV